MNYEQKNRSLLQKRDAVLAARVATAGDDVPVSLQATPSGFPTLIVQTPRQAYALHHPQDPIGQSRSFLGSLDHWRKARNIVVIGGGLCYIPLLIHQQQPNLQYLFILEPSLSVFRAAMMAVDLSPLLQDTRVRFVVGPEPGLIYNALLSNVMDLLANPLIAQEIPSVTAPFRQWAESAKQQIRNVIQFGESGLKTKFRHGTLTLGNLLRNLESVDASPGLIHLGRSLCGVPAIIVAAGPSLKKNLLLLREINDDFFLLASDTAFETLRKNGIVPHGVITVDPTALNLKHFPAETYDEESVLLFDPEARPEIVAKFPRRMTFMTDKHPFFGWLDRSLGGKGVISKGTMVSQAGMYAAHALGCSPLILIGQDLALDPETGHTHNPGTAYCRQAQFLENDRDHVDIPIPTDAQPLSRETLFWVEGVNGGMVPTVHNFLVYLRLLEKDIRLLGLDVIDATEGGAKIQGSRIMALRDALAAHRGSGVQVSKAFRNIPTSFGRDSASRARQLKHSLRDLLRAKAALAQEGFQQWENLSNASLPVVEKAIAFYQERIFADPLAEYLIEYSSSRELFEFMRKGPADMSLEEALAWERNRLQCLLKTATLAPERLEEYF